MACLKGIDWSTSPRARAHCSECVVYLDLTLASTVLLRLLTLQTISHGEYKSVCCVSD